MHLIYTQWHHLSSVPSVDWWTMLIQPMAVTKCCPPDGSHPRWSPHTRPRQPKAHWWGLSPLWWIGPRNPLGPRHSPCPCCHSPLPPPSYPRSSHQESLTLAAGTFRIPLTTLYTGCGPPLWSLQRCLRCQAAGTWCGCSWWGQHHCPASCSRAHPWSTVSAGCTTDTPHPCHSSGHGMPALAMAAVAWSWVEKILQLDHCTSPPRQTWVSLRTAVSTVTCRGTATWPPSVTWRWRTSPACVSGVASHSLWGPGLCVPRQPGWSQWLCKAACRTCWQHFCFCKERWMPAKGAGPQSGNKSWQGSTAQGENRIF